MRVVEVPEDGPAAQAGLREEDWVIAIDGKPVAELTYDEVYAAFKGEVGSYAVLSVMREEKPLELRVERVPYNQPRQRRAFR